MDESHHYHADAAMGSLDRIDPLIGLEFTATPYTGNMVGRGRTRQPELKKNILGLQEIEWVNSRVSCTCTSALSTANTLRHANRMPVAG